MRQILFRIRLDFLWSADAINVPTEGPVDAIGTGYLFLLWLAFGGLWLYRNRQRFDIKQPETIVPLFFWSMISIVLLTAPWWRGDSVPYGIPVYGYGFMLFLGFLLGGWTATRRAAQVGIEKEVIWDCAMWLFFAGILGARLFYLIQYHEQIFANKQGAAAFKAAFNLTNGGLVFYGGAILGAIGYFVFCKRRNLSPLQMGDVIIPSGFLGLAFGRFGCFLNSCCYGGPTDLPWGVQFPIGSAAYGALAQRGHEFVAGDLTIPLHPTQIYSSLSALILFFVSSWYFRHRPRDGAVLAFGWLTYPIIRFVIEWIRNDEPGRFNTTLTISQWVSVVLFVSGLAFLFWLWQRESASTGSPQKPVNSS